MKAKIRHIFQAVVGTVLTILGFGGCSAIKDIYFDQTHTAPEYGVPHATYHITGSVISEESGLPIKGIVVRYRSSIDGSFNTKIETTTDTEGKVSASCQDWPDVENVEITFEDTDGEDNGGSFLPDTLGRNDLKIDQFTVSFEAKLKVLNPE